MKKLALLFVALVCAVVSMVSVVKAENPPQFERTWGYCSQNYEPGTFSFPGGLTVDGSGLVYVSDVNPNLARGRIQVFDPNGIFLRQWDSQYAFPGNIHMGRDDTLYVLEAQLNSYTEVVMARYSLLGTPLGSFVLAPSTDGFAPSDFAIDQNNGEIYVVYFLANMIRVYSSNGQLLRSWGTTGSGAGQLQNPTGITLDQNGLVYVDDGCNNRIQVFDTVGNYVRQFPITGCNAEQTITYGKDGRIYACGFPTSHVSVYTTTGNLVVQWGESGSGPQQFLGTMSVAMNNNGNIYVLDRPNCRVVKFGPLQLAPPPFVMEWYPCGSVSGSWQQCLPVAVSTDNTGNCYVAENLYHYDPETGSYRGGRVTKFSGSGLLKTSWDISQGLTGVHVPLSMATAADGTTYLTAAYCSDFCSSTALVYKYDPNGNRLATFNFNVDGAIALDPSGTHLYTLERQAGAVDKYTTEGAPELSWGTYGAGDGQFEYPNAICTDHDGNVYVGDGTGRIQKFTANGVFIWARGSHGSGPGQFSNIYSITQGPDGNIWVGDGGLARISIFSTNGDFLLNWGSSGNGHGQFSVPGSMAVDLQENIFIADLIDNGRIQKFGPGPGLPPILFVHGLCSDEGMWDTNGFKQAFIAAGFPVHVISFTDHSARPKADVNQLADSIRAIPGNSVIVVAHSMGGLVAREYIAQQHDSGQPSKISTLITLGTPHHGSEMARVAQNVHSGLGLILGRPLSFVEDLVCQLSADALKDLTPSSGFINGLNYGANTNNYDRYPYTSVSHAEEDLRDPSIKFFTIAGTDGLCPPQDKLAGILAWGLFSQYNDGVVTKESAQLYQTQNVVNRTDQQMGLPPLDHSSGPQYLAFCGDSYVENTQVPGILINAIMGLGLPLNPQPQLLASSTDVGQDEVADLPILAGYVNAGLVQEQPFNIPSSSSLRVLALTSGAHLQLRRPNGTLLTAADTATVSGLEFISSPSDTAEALVFANAEAGQWHVVIDATESGDQDYGVIIKVASSVTGSLQASPQVLYPTQSTIIRAQVDSASVTLPNVAWTCSVTAPDSTTSNLTLYDDGAHSDSLANDGIFGNTFAPTRAFGFYDLAANVTLSDGVTLVTGTNVELAPANDLVVLSSEILLSRNSVAAGDSIEVLAIVHNNGPSAVTGALVEVWDDKTGIRLDSLNVDIPAGQAVGIASPWVVTLPDTHSIRVTISPFTLSSEISYTNNSGFKQVVLGRPVNAVEPKTKSGSLQLAPPIPNPSTNSTTLRFSLPQDSKASLVIYDVLGRRIREWTWAKLPAGPHLVQWDGKTSDGQKVTPGVLFYRLESNGQALKQKLIHLQ